MDSNLIAAVLSCCGTVAGSFFGVIISSSLTRYRVKQLEEKVEKHNQVVERVYKLEVSTKSAHHRIDELREEITYDK